MHQLSRSLTYRTAEKHVRNYGTESDVIVTHHEAMECCDCDTFLQLGIDAFDWLIRADQEIREALANGREVASGVDVDKAFEVLCKGWLHSADVAKQQISIHQYRGYDLGNLGEFESRYAEMQAIVGFFDRSENQNLPDALIVLQDQAIAEHNNGETAEFV